MPGCAGLPLSATTCSWAKPGSVTSNGRIRVIARGHGDWIAISGRFAIVDGPVLPTGWATRDIGAVGVAGSTSESAGTWLVEGSGADIWGAADEFRFAYRTASAEFTLTARVENIENLHRWVKEGIMVREDLSPGSRHVSLLHPAHGAWDCVQRRMTTNGDSVHSNGRPSGARVAASRQRGQQHQRVLRGSANWSVAPGWTRECRICATDVRQASPVSSNRRGARHCPVRQRAVVHGTDEPAEDIGDVALTGRTTFDGVVLNPRRIRGGNGARLTIPFLWTWGYYRLSINSIARGSGRWRTPITGRRGCHVPGDLRRGASMEAKARHVMASCLQERDRDAGPAGRWRSECAGGRATRRRNRHSCADAGRGQLYRPDVDRGMTWEVLGQVALPSFHPAPGWLVTEPRQPAKTCHGRLRRGR